MSVVEVEVAARGRKLGSRWLRIDCAQLRVMCAVKRSCYDSVAMLSMADVVDAVSRACVL